MFAGAAEGVMIVVAPTEAELVLAALLDLGGAIAAFPIGALGGEEEFAREIRANELQALVENVVCGLKAFQVVGKKTATSVPEFFGPDDAAEVSSIQWRGDESTIGMALDSFQARAIFFGDDDSAVTG